MPIVIAMIVLVNEIIIERLKHFTTFFENVMQDNINNSNNTTRITSDAKFSTNGR